MLLRSPTQVIVFALGLFLGACADPATPTPAQVDAWPQPIDPQSDEWGESDGAERKGWLEELRGAPPGVDWRAHELRAETTLARAAPSAALDWREVGSSNQAGHTRCASLSSSGALYLGSANGGLWRGDLGGAGWTATSDDLFGGVDEVLSFEGESGDDLVLRRGTGLFRRAADEGEWSEVRGLPQLEEVRRLARIPGTDSALLLARAVDTAAEDRQASLTLYRSVDRGRSFREVLGGLGAGRGDLWLPRSVDAHAGFVALAVGNSVLRSLDGGRSFQSWCTLPGAVDEVRLAGSEAGAPRVYAASRDGEAWSLQRLEGDEPVESLGPLHGSWGSLVAAPGDADILLYGGLECHRSRDGGRSFERVNDWVEYYLNPATSLHADVRGLDAFPDPAGGPGLLLAHTDGGSYLSRDGALSWLNLCQSGLGVAQVYSTLTDARDNRVIAAGTQDQGFQLGRIPEAGGLAAFDQLLSGDYGFLCSPAGTHERLIASYPDFVLVVEDRASPRLTRLAHPPAAQAGWLPPLEVRPGEGDAFYLLGDQLYRYEADDAGRWTPRPQSPRRFDEDGARYLAALDFAPSESRYAVCADDLGRAFLSADGGRSWVPAAGPLRDGEHLRPTDIEFHPRDASVVVLAGSGLAGAPVRRSLDGGRTWSDFAAGLPSALVLDLEWCGPEALYAATVLGPFRWTAADGRWVSLLGGDAPATTYWSAEWVPAASVVRFGTYGRGIWDLALQAPTAPR